MKKKNEDYEELKYDDVLQASDEDEFEIGQCYEDEPAKKLICKKCTGSQWIVGVGDYFTAIKCPTCKYEISIHEG